MATYTRTQNPSRFSLNNPNVTNGQFIQFLRNGFQQPASDNTLSTIIGTDLTYTAEEVINRYIVRSGISGPSVDYLPTALQIIEALNRDQSIRATAQDLVPHYVHNGFYFDVTIVNNDSDHTITILPDIGITIGFSGSISVRPQTAVVLRVQILNIAELSPSVYVSILTTEQVPAGVIHAFGASEAPVGYLMCNGNAVSRDFYSTLFEVIGTTYGSGDGITTFNLPDFRGRVPVGVEQESDYFPILGEEGGVTDVTLTIAQMPTHLHTGTTDLAGLHLHTGTTDIAGDHAHSITDPGHSHTYLGVQSQGAASGLDNVAENSPRPTEATSTQTTGITINNNGNHVHTFTSATDGSHVHTFTSTTTGGSESHTNVQPYLTVNYIIKY